MRQIAIALVLFQLIGCAKQPCVITHAASKTPTKTPLENTQKAPKAREFTVGEQMGALVLLLAGIGTLSFFFISMARRVRTPKP